MNLEEALKEIKRLEQLNRDLSKEHEKTLRLLFEANEKLNLILKDKENVVEKYTIERVKTFIPRTEVMTPVIINEVEALVKEKKIRKEKSRNFENFDFERHVSETRYEKPEISACPSCGHDLSIASEKVRYVVESIPATLKVTKIIKQSCKCSVCNPKDNQVYYPLSTSLFPGSIMTHSFASYITYHKYELGIPFEHLSRHIKETLDIEISKQNLALYMAKMANIIAPLYHQMKNDLLHNQVGVIHADETTLSISKRPEVEKIVRKAMFMSTHQAIMTSRSQSMIFMNQERLTRQPLGYQIMRVPSCVMIMQDIPNSRKITQRLNCKGASPMSEDASQTSSKPYLKKTYQAVTQKRYWISSVNSFISSPSIKRKS